MAGDALVREERRGVRRGELLDAAVEAIRVAGPGATMEQLARAGGVTKPILYRHFRDRDGLITAIAERFGADLLSSVQAPLATELEQPQRVLQSTIDAYVGFIERDPHLYRFLIRHAPDRGAGLASVSALADVIAKQVAIVIGEGLRAAGRDSGAAVPWAYGIVGLVHQAGDWWLDDQTMTRERLVGYLTSLLWDGLSGQGEPVT
ncbi:MAG TPA: TetR/AcrR family transcriptional regulator [Acidimicrobiales bacterium]